MQKDAEAYVKKCEKCQRFAPLIHQPAADLHPVSSPWPFAQWGMDLVGQLPQATRQRKYLLVATDYFTKWIEAEPLAKIRDVDVKNFIWRNIITRFRIPRAIVVDNGTQFDSNQIKSFCAKFKIKNYFSTPSFPQSNGQAEASTKLS